MSNTNIFKIFARWSSAVRFQCELSAEMSKKPQSQQRGYAIKKALAKNVDLRGADLSGADLSGSNLSDSNLSGADLSGCDLRDSNLRGSNLRGADLSGADLSGADLRDSNLRGSNLSGANLRGCDLRDSDLRGADLSGANLSGADLSDSNLSGADLSGADLRYSNLSDSDLSAIRADLFDVLVTARVEAPAFLAALKSGRVDGSVYHGECACLVGTIANARGVDPDSLFCDASRPIERFVMGIKKGDTPDTNPVSALVAEWTQLFIGE